MAKHVKCKDMSVTAHTKTHQYVILYIFTIIMRIKLNKMMFTCFATDCTMPWLDCVFGSWAGYLSCFNLECTMVRIYKCV